MTNFQAETNRPTAAWLTPERAVVVVPILAGLALAATLASAVITPQLVQLRQKRFQLRSSSDQAQQALLLGHHLRLLKTTLSQNLHQPWQGVAFLLQDINH